MSESHPSHVTGSSSSSSLMITTTELRAEATATIKTTNATTITEDEYPLHPTIIYFALKCLLGIVTLAIVLLALYYRPFSCEGICYLAAEERGSCASRNPKFLYFHHLQDVFDEEFLVHVKDSKNKKGFSWISQAKPLFELESNAPGETFFAVDRFHKGLKESFDHIPWEIASRANHSLFDGLTPVFDWTLLGISGESISIVRHPHFRLKMLYEKSMAKIPQGVYKSMTSQAKPVSFQECLFSDRCRLFMNLDRACQMLTSLFCGPECQALPMTEALLDRAMINFKEKFSLVGVAEDSTSTGTMLRLMFPTFFEFLPGNFSLPRKTYYFDDKATSILNEVCKFDDRLYDEIARTFVERASTCGITSAILK